METEPKDINHAGFLLHTPRKNSFQSTGPEKMLHLSTL
jgi:hypothetical protein